MSTKIFNGYILPRMSFLQLQKRVYEMRSKMSAVLEEEYCKLHAILTARLADTIAAEGWPQKREFKQHNTLFWEIYWQIEDEFSKGEDGDGGVYRKLKCEAVFFPHKEGIVALLFTANAAFTKAFEETRGVQEFYYWDNTDKPKKISKEEWMRRGRIWSEVLPGAGVPIENGFLVDFTAVLPFGDLTKKIISYVPSKEQRAEVIAFNHVVNKRYEKLIAGQENKIQMSLYCDARRWGRNEGRNQVKREQRRLMELLPDIDEVFIEKNVTDIVEMYKNKANKKDRQD